MLLEVESTKSLVHTNVDNYCSIVPISFKFGRKLGIVTLNHVPKRFRIIFIGARKIALLGFLEAATKLQHHFQNLTPRGLNEATIPITPGN